MKNVKYRTIKTIFGTFFCRILATFVYLKFE